MRAILIVAALVASAPAWGQSLGQTPGPLIAAGSDNTGIGGIGVIATPEELKAAAAQTDNAIRVAIGSAFGTAYNCPHAPTDGERGQSFCAIAVGLGALQDAIAPRNTIAIGRCAGASLTNESDDMLLGDYTAAPAGKNGFINFANKLCFWRDTGERAACPAPEPECGKGKP
jgi:hypothetical protein